MSWWTWRDAHGTVIERIDGQLLDVSTSGCRLETTSPLPIGSVGVIELHDLPTAVVEAARVRHAFERPGAAVRHVLHFEFLPMPLPSRAPARAVVGAPAPSTVRGPLPGSGERSGPSPTTPTITDRAADAGSANNAAISRKSRAHAARPRLSNGWQAD